MGAVSIKELAANNGSSWLSQAPNLHLAMQLLTRKWPNAMTIKRQKQKTFLTHYYESFEIADHRHTSEKSQVQ